jgi:ribosomal protein S18 acetylase RimI-like enzyme
MIEIRTVRTSDAALLRDIHLRMYADAPDAFSETLAQARAMTAQDWQQRAQQYADGPNAVAFVAIEAEATYGFIAGFVGCWRDGAMHRDDRDAVTMARAWVDPAQRRRGVGRALTEAVASWAKEKRAQTLEVQVTENNGAAVEFYRKLDFTDTGGREPLLSNPALQILFLARPVSRPIGRTARCLV